MLQLKQLVLKTLRGPSHILQASSTLQSPFSNRQRLDEKQDSCPLGREASRVKHRRAVFNTVRCN